MPDAAVDLRALADKLGCTGFAVSAEVPPFTTQYATCELNGQRVQLYATPDPAAFVRAMAGYGVTAAMVVQGPGWLVAPRDPAMVPEIRAALT